MSKVQVSVSEAYKLIPEDIKAIWKGALIATIGALLTYATTFISGGNFGMYTPCIVALWSVLANIIRKYISTQTYVK